MLFNSEIKRNKGNISINMKLLFAILVFFSVTFSPRANSFENGKDAFLNNKPVEAAIFFEQALNDEPNNEDVLMYLGLSYIQSGQTDKAISKFLDGADLKGNQEGRFYLNAGNAYFSINNLDDALDIYNVIIENNLPEKGDALLNRANILMNQEELSGAVSVYREYLIVEPQSEQKDKIVRLISLIETKMKDEALEAERLAAEAERLAAEAERLRLAEEQKQADAAAESERLRLAEERRKADEAARQQALMDEILNSLSTISDETQNISADSETIINTDEESDIDD